MSGRRDAEKGQRLWQAGRYDEARQAFERAASRIEANGLVPLAATVRGRLGLSLLTIDPVRAVENLRYAVDLVESTLTSAHDPHMEINAVYEVLVWQMAQRTHGNALDTGNGVATLHLVERSKSRRLLRMLGEAVPMPHGVAETLYQEERMLMDRYREAQHAVAAATGQDAASVALRQLRSVGADLDKCRDALRDAGLGGAEYVQLRRGQPMTYQELCELLPAGRPRDQAR